MSSGALLFLLSVTGCSSGDSGASASDVLDTTTTTSSTENAPIAAPTTSLDTTSSTATSVPTTAASTSTTDAVAAQPGESTDVASATLPPTNSGATFSASITEIDDVVAARLTHSWREGCPVGLAELRLLTISHWNFAGSAATGELIVHRDHAEGIVAVFEKLFAARFPIERMELVDAYAGDDDQSMAANNTSAFNCREVAWKPGVWSNHAFGTAIDINPLVNPYVSTTRVLPPEGAPFADRTVETLGGLYAGDVATTALADIGWIWGGTWSPAKDWQHFSVSGG